MAQVGDGRRSGHFWQVEQTESGARWVASCECGYISATRTTERLALGAAFHHFAAEEVRSRVDGLSTTRGESAGRFWGSARGRRDDVVA